MLYTKIHGNRRRRFLKVFTIYGHGGHLGHVTWTIYIHFCSRPFPMRLHVKFGFNWPSGSGGEDVWNCWPRPRRPQRRRLRWPKNTDFHSILASKLRRRKTKFSTVYPTIYLPKWKIWIQNSAVNNAAKLFVSFCLFALMLYYKTIVEHWGIRYDEISTREYQNWPWLCLGHYWYSLVEITSLPMPKYLIIV